MKSALRTCLAAAGVLAALATEVSLGAVAIVSQIRTLDVSATAPSPNGTETITNAANAPNVFSWSHSIEANTGSSVGRASQMSSMSGGAIGRFSAQLSASAQRFGVSTGAGGQSRYQVVFDVTGASPLTGLGYMIDFTALASGEGFASVTATMNGPTGFSWERRPSGGIQIDTFPASPFIAVLSNGRYTLDLRCTVGASFGSGTLPANTSLSWSMTVVPAPVTGSLGLGLMGLLRQRQRPKLGVSSIHLAAV